MEKITVDEVKSSLEYKWHVLALKQNLWFLAVCIVLLVTGCLVLFVFKTDATPHTKSSAIVGLFLWILPFCHIVYHSCAKRYLLNNYQKFQVYETTLTSASRSVWFYFSTYFSVQIDDGGKFISTTTNPCFGNMRWGRDLQNIYHGSKVIGLYDSKKNVFYVLHKSLRNNSTTEH